MINKFNAALVAKAYLEYEELSWGLFPYDCGQVDYNLSMFLSEHVPDEKRQEFWDAVGKMKGE